LWGTPSVRNVSARRDFAASRASHQQPSPRTFLARIGSFPKEKRPMPKPNYSFQKRQRELAKKQKKEAKLREREAGKAPAEAAVPDAAPAPQTETHGG
jgi:hypothetical protein